MSVKSHSKIVLNEHSVNVLLKQILGKESPVRSFKATHEDHHLHLKIGINYDHVPGRIYVPFLGWVHPLQPLMGDHVEADFRLSVSGHNLKGNLDFHGMGAVIQRAVGMLGIDSIIFFFAPHLKKVGALRIHGVYGCQIAGSTPPDNPMPSSNDFPAAFRSGLAGL